MHKRFALTALATALALTSGWVQAAPPPAEAGDKAAPPAVQGKDFQGETLLTVNGQPITGEMFGIYFNERIQKMPGAHNSPEMQNQLVNEMINMMVLAQEARNQGLDKLPNIMTVLEMQRDQLLSRMILQQYAQQHPPTDEELNKAYQENFVNKPEQEYKARHILVKTEDEAKKIIAELKDKGVAAFPELAKQHSTDPGSKESGGDLGWFGPDQMVKPFADATRKLAPGQYTETPVQSQFGWHVILLDETRKKEIPSLDAVRPQLVANHQRKALADFMNGLREKAKIEVNESLQKGQAPAQQPPAQ